MWSSVSVRHVFLTPSLDESGGCSEHTARLRVLSQCLDLQLPFSGVTAAAAAPPFSRVPYEAVLFVEVSDPSRGPLGRAAVLLKDLRDCEGWVSVQVELMAPSGDASRQWAPARRVLCLDLCVITPAAAHAHGGLPDEFTVTALELACPGCSFGAVLLSYGLQGGREVKLPSSAGAEAGATGQPQRWEGRVGFRWEENQPLILLQPLPEASTEVEGDAAEDRPGDAEAVSLVVSPLLDTTLRRRVPALRRLPFAGGYLTLTFEVLELPASVGLAAEDLALQQGLCGEFPAPTGVLVGCLTLAGVRVTSLGLPAGAEASLTVERSQERRGGKEWRAGGA
eukprot:RCo028725